MKKPFTRLFSKLLLVCAWGTGLSAWGQTTYSTVPLAATSFTADIVANGSAALSPVSSTTADVDGAGYYFMSQDYYTATTAHTSGIPNNGTIANSIAGLSALTYQLASLSANNSLRLSGVTSGTVTFATARAASEIYVLGSSGSGISTMDVTVTYTDGTTTAFTGQNYPDWFTVDATRNVFGCTGRATTTTPVSTPYTASNTAPFLDQLKLTVPSAKLSSLIASITFAKTSTGGVLNIMAVSVGTTPLCTTPPTNLTTVASTTAAGGTALTTACSGTSIYLSVSGVPGNAGYTYQWQSSTTSATTGFSNISGATSSTYTATGQTATTYYRVLVDCQFAGTGSTPTAATAVQVTQSPLTACYCTPTYSNGGTNDFVARVRLGTLDNNTTSAGNVSPYYHDYSSLQTGTAPSLTIPVLNSGSTATVTFNFGSDGSQYSAVWIDFNQNGTFEASEYFTQGTNAGANGTATISVAVPAAAAPGNTRMRVRGGDDSQPTSGQACGASSSTYGEAEDYLVNISSPCTPSTATFNYGTPATYCISGTTNPVVTLASGATAGTFSSTTGLTLSTTTGAITLSSSTPGTYTVTNTVAGSATICSSTATTTVTITAAPTATFSYPTTGVCAGRAATVSPTLGTGATAGTFTLPTAVTGLTINATTGALTTTTAIATGSYTVTNTVAAANGCAAVTGTATVTVNAAPATPTLTVTGTPATGITLTSSAATGNQFYLNAVAVPGATGQTYFINSGTRNGSYTVVVTNAAGCTATSAATSVVVTATTPAQAATSLMVSPNPTPDGHLLLELAGLHETVALTVLNTLGQRVYEGVVMATALTQPQPLNLTTLPAGVYLLRAQTANGLTQTLRFVRE